MTKDPIKTIYVLMDVAKVSSEDDPTPVGQLIGIFDDEEEATKAANTYNQIIYGRDLINWFYECRVIKKEVYSNADYFILKEMQNV